MFKNISLPKLDYINAYIALIEQIELQEDIDSVTELFKFYFEDDWENALSGYFVFNLKVWLGYTTEMLDVFYIRQGLGTFANTYGAFVKPIYKMKFFMEYVIEHDLQETLNVYITEFYELYYNDMYKRVTMLGNNAYVSYLVSADNDFEFDAVKILFDEYINDLRKNVEHKPNIEWEFFKDTDSFLSIIVRDLDFLHPYYYSTFRSQKFTSQNSHQDIYDMYVNEFEKFIAKELSDEENIYNELRWGVSYATGEITLEEFRQRVPFNGSTFTWDTDNQISYNYNKEEDGGSWDDFDWNSLLNGGK